MRKISLLFAMVLLAMLMVPQAARTQGAQFPVVSADDLKAEMDSGKKVFIVDARNRDEYNKGHLPGALSVPPEAFNYLPGYLPQNKSYPIVIYCRGRG
ncbi:MAG: rhodanese-like domain-containing protein [Thermodesulfovibrionales bacterium]|nr:rhodanese-like domain-containing protein [Thermodesulfovibrionales bacterium]